ncbi:D-alanyl-D-alanine dipeptidase [Piscinibacter sakaiensis]|uniref:D-alanyl-D-alanine dipeptidase n=1 Tax=Piscinibacter sakaiensis TaxID=1547922 RepID=UPI003AB0082E
MPLLPITDPAIDLDQRYASADNITGKPIYDRAVALLHPDAHAALLRAAGLAAAQGLRLHLFDAYRPVAAQWQLWQTLPAPDFIADPRRGSAHSRGVAVDLTLATAGRVPLEMGTGFDDMTPQSGHARTDIPVPAQHNRLLLLGLMAAAGWRHNPREWWHYNLPDPAAYPLIDDAADGRLLMDLR